VKGQHNEEASLLVAATSPKRTEDRESTKRYDEEGFHETPPRRIVSGNMNYKTIIRSRSHALRLPSVSFVVWVALMELDGGGSWYRRGWWVSTMLLWVGSTRWSGPMGSGSVPRFLCFGVLLGNVN